MLATPLLVASPFFWLAIAIAAALGGAGGWYAHRVGEACRRRALDAYHREAIRVVGCARDRAREETAELEDRLERFRVRHGTAASGNGGNGNGNGAHAPAWLLEAPQGATDDLKTIRGLGPAYERKLNQLGVFHFRQLAQLDDAAIAWFAPRLGVLPKRIRRDDWAAQARELSGNAETEPATSLQAQRPGPGRRR